MSTSTAPSSSHPNVTRINLTEPQDSRKETSLYFHPVNVDFRFICRAARVGLFSVRLGAGQCGNVGSRPAREAFSARARRPLCAGNSFFVKIPDETPYNAIKGRGETCPGRVRHVQCSWSALAHRLLSGRCAPERERAPVTEAVRKRERPPSRVNSRGTG